VDGEIGRIRSVLAGWGYRLGRDDDQMLPMVACQMLLLNRSPHLEDLSTGLFERVRRERLLPAARGNTLHAMQRAVAELGFCDPPQRLTGCHSLRASGGPPVWEAQVERWHGTSALSPRVRDSVRATLLKAGRREEALADVVYQAAPATEAARVYVACRSRLRRPRSYLVVVRGSAWEAASWTSRSGPKLGCECLRSLRLERIGARHAVSCLAQELSGSGYPGSRARAGIIAVRMTPGISPRSSLTCGQQATGPQQSAAEPGQL